MISYCQLGVNIAMISSDLQVRIICFTSQKFIVFLFTLIGVLNLDFFHFVIPPLCISTTMKSIYTLLFDYVIAVYPIVLTVFINVSVELHDRNYSIIVYLTSPLKWFWRKNWNPKETILNTCATFLLFPYSKFLFVSPSLLLMSIHMTVHVVKR